MLLFLFSHPLVSESLWPHGLQHTRLPCPSLSPQICSNSCPLSWWCHLTFSSSAALFSFCLQSFLASGSFPVSWLFVSGSQSIGALASIFPINIQGWFPLGLTGLISLLSMGLSKSLPQHYNSKASILWHSAFFMVQFSQLCLLENHSFDYMKLLPKWCLCFSKALSRFVIAFLPRSKVSFNFMATVTICSDFGAHENKI